MRVSILRRDMVNSDWGVLNAVKCSPDKESGYDHVIPVLEASDTKLIKYLAEHNYWTAFSHTQEIFDLPLSRDEISCFLLRANLSGFEWLLPKARNNVSMWRVMGNLYAWLSNVDKLPESISQSIRQYLYERYPVSYDAIAPQSMKSSVRIRRRTIPIDICSEDKLRAVTLELRCPIFVENQLRIHCQNLIVTNVEDFSQDKVSQRLGYLVRDPEFYKPKMWKRQLRAGEQRSESDNDLCVSVRDAALNTYDYDHVMNNIDLYYRAISSRGTDYETNRIILPLSTYTTSWWTGSLRTWERFITLSTHLNTEGKIIAGMIRELL